MNRMKTTRRRLFIACVMFAAVINYVSRLPMKVSFVVDKANGPSVTQALVGADVRSMSVENMGMNMRITVTSRQELDTATAAIATDAIRGGFRARIETHALVPIFNRVRTIEEKVVSNAKPATVDEKESTHQFGPFACTIPSGWMVFPPDGRNNIAVIVPKGTTKETIKAAIRVDTGTPNEPTPMELAEQFTKRTGGVIVDKRMELDGEECVAATTKSNTFKTPRNMIIAFRNGKVFLLMAGGVKDVDLETPLAKIRESWKWTD